MKIAIIRSPQPYLIGENSGGLYSPNRLLAPEPTLPLLEGIVRIVAEENGLEIKVRQLDLRDSKNGKIKHNDYGKVNLSYLNENLIKMCSGVSIEDQFDEISNCDAVGFTNNFTMVRNVVRDSIRRVRERFPDKEIWVGGRDVFPEQIAGLYAEAAGKRNVVIFNGHVFGSLPEYIQFKAGKDASLQGITIYDKNQRRINLPIISLTKLGKDSLFNRAIPVYPDPTVLGHFNYSGEGPTDEGYDRFAHITTSIGCSHDCGYCTTGWREHYLVSRDLQSIKKELDYYRSLGVNTLAIMDDNLISIGPKKLNQLMELINSYAFNIEYGNGLELRLLHKYWDEIHESVLMNCNVLYAPLEDLTSEVSYKKSEPVEEQLKLMQKIADYFDRNSKEKPRYVTMGVILGVPGHTNSGLYNVLPQNVENFLELFINKNINIAMTAFNYMPLVGTSFGNQAIASKRIVTDIVREHPEVVNFELVTYAPEGSTHAEVFEAYKRIINLNPAGRLDSHGKSLGTDYEHLKRFGERALDKMPQQWAELGKEFTSGKVAGAGLHYKVPMTIEIAEENRKRIKQL